MIIVVIVISHQDHLGHHDHDLCEADGTAVVGVERNSQLVVVPQRVRCALGLKQPDGDDYLGMRSMGMMRKQWLMTVVAVRIIRIKVTEAVKVMITMMMTMMMRMMMITCNFCPLPFSAFSMHSS